MTVRGGLLERDSVTEAVAGLVGAVGAGQAGALFVVGEAGLGKTSVIDQACRLAAKADLAVGLGRGDPMETGLPFGLLAQALDGVGGRELLSGGAPRLAGADDRGNRFYRVLRWLQERAGRALLLAIDDLHWADADSLALLSFLCRRIGSAPVGLVATLRPWPAGAREMVEPLAGTGGGRLCRLGPLSEAAAGELLETRLGRPLPQELRRRAFVLCAGNPLLLEQLAVAIGEGAVVPQGAGAAASGRGVLLARFAGLPPPGTRYAQAASVLGIRFQPEIAAQVAGLDGGEVDAALESLGRTGLVGQQPGCAAEFVHPLFRQALYEDLIGPVRARLHARAFTVLHARGLDAQAAEHAIAAGLAGDAEAAAVLEQAGRDARRVGALATAIRWLDAAVAMAGQRASISLLLAQAEVLLASGRARVDTLWALGQALAMAGDQDPVAAGRGGRADIARAASRDSATPMRPDAAPGRALTAGSARMLAFADRAGDLTGSPDGQLPGGAEEDRPELALLGAGSAGGPATPRHVSRPGADADMATLDSGPEPGSGLADCSCLVERLAEAERAFAAARASAEDAGVFEAVATLAVGHSYTLTRMGRLDEALAAIDAALSRVDLVPMMAAYAAVGRAYIQLYRGELADSAQCCQQAEAAAAGGQSLAQLFSWDVLGHRRLREGATAESCDCYARLEATVQLMGIGEPCLPPWPRHAISAYLTAGRIADAERVLAWLDRSAQRMPCRFARIASAAGRARLAELRGDRDTAQAHFRDALALHQEVDLPVEYAETLLDCGAFLRRYGQPIRARRMLGQAIEVAEAAQARWLAGLAHAELRVAGGRRRRPAALELTAQEGRVAAQAATGASNPQIARQLSVSVSTVETHLERIYAKLGIKSRHELIAIAAARGSIPPAADVRSVLPLPSARRQNLGDFPDASGRDTLPDYAQVPSDQRKPRRKAR